MADKHLLSQFVLFLFKKNKLSNDIVHKVETDLNYLSKEYTTLLNLRKEFLAWRESQEDFLKFAVFFWVRKEKNISTISEESLLNYSSLFTDNELDEVQQLILEFLESDYYLGRKRILQLEESKTLSDKAKKWVEKFKQHLNKTKEKSVVTRFTNQVIEALDKENEDIEKLNKWEKKPTSVKIFLSFYKRNMLTNCNTEDDEDDEEMEYEEGNEEIEDEEGNEEIEDEEGNESNPKRHKRLRLMEDEELSDSSTSQDKCQLNTSSCLDD